jgi:hypothetical protein
VLDLGVEVRDQPMKELVTTDLVVERCLHLATLMASSRLLRVS